MGWDWAGQSPGLLWDTQGANSRGAVSPVFLGWTLGPAGLAGDSLIFGCSARLSCSVSVWPSLGRMRDGGASAKEEGEKAGCLRRRFWTW